MPRQRKPTPERYCQSCGERLERKIINGRLEDLAQFIRRKNCNVLCMAKGMVKQKVDRTMYHKRARVYLKSNCEQCQTTENLAVHHRNGDITDNAPANLMTLCSSCHLKLHWQNGKTIPKRQKKPCTICGKPAEGRGYCMNHYRHFMKYGDPLLTKKSGRSDGTLIKETNIEYQNLSPSETP